MKKIIYVVLFLFVMPHIADPQKVQAKSLTPQTCKKARDVFRQLNPQVSVLERQARKASQEKRPLPENKKAFNYFLMMRLFHAYSAVIVLRCQHPSIIFVIKKTPLIEVDTNNPWNSLWKRLQKGLVLLTFPKDSNKKTLNLLTKELERFGFTVISQQK